MEKAPFLKHWAKLRVDQKPQTTGAPAAAIPGGNTPSRRIIRLSA